MCNHHLNYILRQVGFKQSSVDECVWYKYKTIFFYYVDDDIFMRSDSKAIDREIKDMEKSWLGTTHPRLCMGHEEKSIHCY